MDGRHEGSGTGVDGPLEETCGRLRKHPRLGSMGRRGRRRVEGKGAGGGVRSQE